MLADYVNKASQGLDDCMLPVVEVSSTRMILRLYLYNVLTDIRVNMVYQLLKIKCCQISNLVALATIGVVKTVVYWNYFLFF